MKFKNIEKSYLRNKKWYKIFQILLIIVLSSFTLTLHTCKPDDEYGKTYGPYTLGEARDYLDFKPGSWWVYQNNKSGLYDTLVLKVLNIKTQTFTGKNTVIKDIINFVIVSQTFNDEYKFYNLFVPNPDLPPKYLDNPFIDLACGKSNKTGYFGEPITFFYPFDNLVKRSGSGTHSIYYGIDSIFKIKDNNYYDVRKYYIEKDGTWDRWDVNYYWAKKVGLIKKENISKGESWDLVNYKLLK